MKKIGKYYILVFILLLIMMVSYKASYAFFNDTKEEHGKLNVVVGDLKYKLESDSLDNDSIVVEANTSKEIKVKITSLNGISSKYELYYILDKANDKMSVGYSRDTKDSVSGIIDTNSNKMITIVIKNESDINSTITFRVLGGLVNNSLALKDGNSLDKEVNLCSYEKGYVWNFDYTGGEQEFTTPCTGTYKLETWGAQGGSGFNKQLDFIRAGGYGGYSIGYTYLDYKNKLYVNIAGGGTTLVDDTQDISKIIPGGYNGGGSGLCYANGGGATHIASKTGVLSTLKNDIEKILIVSGGGGGTSAHAEGGGYCYGGPGGGFKGNIGKTGKIDYGYDGGKGGTQYSGYLFGFGENSSDVAANDGVSGGGGGLFGGLAGISNNSWNACAGGGSGYIGNPLLTNKVMYCYNCEESSEESTKTISTTCTSETPTENCSKQGNGYAKITYLGD